MKRIQLLFLSIILTLPLAGCNVSGTDKQPEINRELPRELSAREKIIAEGSNDFAFRLLHQLQEKEGNNSFFVSPLSISTAFGMAINGAEGETFEQLQNFFGHEGMTKGEINQAYKDLIKLLTTLDEQVIMNIANSVWYREGVSIKEEFLNNNREYFNAEVRKLDFTDPNAPDIINGWVENKTEGLVKKMIDNIDPDILMYIINAIYFKGDWTVQFDPDNTIDAPFYLANGDTIKVPLMQNQDQFRYYRDEEWTAVDMWYGRAGFSFTAMVPNGDQTLSEQVPKLTRERFTDITSQLQKSTVKIFLPRFELDYKIKGFVEDLREMGLTIPFDKNKADFSAITEEYPLFISNVGHRAVIKLDEEGTEAAAVTTIGIGVISMPQIKTVRLDRPFLFFIRENSTNTILFMGAYTGILN